MRTARGLYTSTKYTSLLASSAAAISVIGLTALAPAQATPPFPLEPGCIQYKFMGQFVLTQANGYLVEFWSTEQTVDSTAFARGSAYDHSDDMSGNVSGGIQGRHMDFTIHWKEGPIGHYTGDIGDDGFVPHGSSWDEAAPESHSRWRSDSQLGCTSSIVVMPVLPP